MKRFDMTIIFLTRLFYPHIGGVEKHALEISKILIKKGYKIIVVTEELSRNDLKTLGDSGQARMTGSIEIYRIPVGKDNWFKKFIIWVWLWKHQDLIKTADIVHCHDVFFWYLPFRFLFPKKPVYTTFHGYEGNSLPSKKAIFMHKLAEKLSKGNICVGDYLSKWYGARPTYVTYGGVSFTKSQISNLKSQNYNSRLRQGFGGQAKFKTVFVGRLEEETGIMEYLKALKILKEKGHELHLDILGDGSQREKAEKFCNSNKLNVSFKGFVNNVFNYLVDVDFVFTSRYLGILEAMGYMKLIFAAYNNDIKKDYLLMAPFSKFIVIANSKEQISSKFVDYLKNPDKEKVMVDKAFEWAKIQSWDKVSQLYVNLWRES